MRKALVTKTDELADLKKRVHQLLSTEDSGAHYAAFFERQTEDLMYAKYKLLAEYEKWENECGRKWNDLLNENILAQEKCQGLKAQLARQRDSF